LGEGLDGDGLEVGIAVIEGFNSAVFNQGSGIGDDSTGRTADMFINLEYFLNGFRDDEGGLQPPLNCKYDSFRALDSNGG